jgi:hypothetical protein
MGYTHYYQLNALKKDLVKLESTYQLAIKDCQKLIYAHNRNLKQLNSKNPDRMSGVTAHVKPGTYLGVAVNGTEDLSHEDFILPAHAEGLLGFTFCKTNRKPYDDVVVAFLLILAHRLGERFDFASDGNRDDMLEGLALALQHTRLAIKIPSSIRGARLRAL